MRHNVRGFATIVLLISAVIFSSCAVHYTPPEEKPEPPSYPSEKLPQIGAKIPKPEASGHRSPVVVARLSDKAKDEMEAGNMEQAYTTAERAVRIDSSNPYLWHLMAQIQLKRGNSYQAEHLARKSNLLAKGDKSLQAKNWRMIAAALRKRGATGEAEAAERKAKELE
jgi:Flp pilus assembly protein TadD